MDEEIRVEKASHRAHRDAIAAYFSAHPHTVVSFETLLAITPNYMQRISECRTQLGMHEIKCVPRFADIDGRRKRITGDFIYRPEALGRDAAEIVSRPDAYTGPLFDQPLSGWQMSAAPRRQED